MEECTPKIPIKPTKTNIVEIRDILYSFYIAVKYISSEERYYPIVYYDLNDLKFEFFQRIAPYDAFTDSKIQYYGIHYPNIINMEIEELTEKRAENKLYDLYVRLKVKRFFFSFDTRLQWKAMESLIKEIRKQFHIKEEDIIRITYTNECKIPNEEKKDRLARIICNIFMRPFPFYVIIIMIILWYYYR